ncbi:hypothetical protein GCM10009535_14740 [Streptomyces thermocarboxydovorans]|uniref:Uncharacterized protein n=1 Tax=Streptomyces thermocarboxydovorans TaxID=59298 RepID=A0ABN1HD68_9ACTN
MGLDRVLRGPAVVRGDDQEGVGAGLLGGAGQFDGVAGVGGADAGDDDAPGADRLADRRDQGGLLLVRGGGGFARRTGEDEAVAAPGDEVVGQALGAGEVEGSGGVKGVTMAQRTRGAGEVGSRSWG